MLQKNKTRVHEISGRREFRTEGFYAFMYEDYNCLVEFFRTPFLVQEWEIDEGNGSNKETNRAFLSNLQLKPTLEDTKSVSNTFLGHQTSFSILFSSHRICNIGIGFWFIYEGVE